MFYSLRQRKRSYKQGRKKKIVFLKKENQKRRRMRKINLISLTWIVLMEGLLIFLRCWLMALSLLSSSSGRRVWFLGERFSDKTEEEDKRRRERKRMLEEQVRNKRIISKKKLLLLLLPRLLSLVIILVSSENNSVSVCLIVLHRSKRRHLLPFLGFLNTNTPPIKTQNVFLILKN